MDANDPSCIDVKKKPQPKIIYDSSQSLEEQVAMDGRFTFTWLFVLLYHVQRYLFMNSEWNLTMRSTQSVPGARKVVRKWKVFSF